ncbi:hypothetical protein [Bradyrhizobium cenepequi]
MTGELNPIIAEAALCLWEACLDAGNPEWRKGWSDETANAAALVEQYRDGWGSFELRHLCIRLAPECERVWQGLNDSDRDQMQFDWEFCPAFVLFCLDWETEPTLETDLNVRADAFERVRAFISRERLARGN